MTWHLPGGIGGKNTSNPSLYGWYHSQDLNQAPPEYKPKVLLLESTKKIIPIMVA
jgi:hypothetical protein